MDKHPVEQKGITWREAIGPLMRLSDIPEAFRGDQGLVLLKTKDGTEVCPVYQFDMDDNGNPNLNRYVAMAWGALSALQISQMGESEWSKAAMLAQPRKEYHMRSWADVLKDPNKSEVEKRLVLEEIVMDAVYSAGYMGIDLTDPRKILPQ